MTYLGTCEIADLGEELKYEYLHPNQEPNIGIYEPNNYIDLNKLPIGTIFECDEFKAQIGSDGCNKYVEIIDVSNRLLYSEMIGKKKYIDITYYKAYNIEIC